MDNKKKNKIPDSYWDRNIDKEIKVKSHRDGEAYTLRELLVRIEELEDKQMDIRYHLANPKTLNY